jgi:hypothetical protein
LVFNGNSFNNGLGLYLYENSATDTMQICGLAGGSSSFGTGGGAGSGSGHLFSGFTPTVNQWFYAAVVVNGSSGADSIYIDSCTTPAATGTGTFNTPAAAGGGNPFHVGFVLGSAGNTNNTNYTVLTASELWGAADDVRVLTWNGTTYVFNPATDLEYPTPEPSTLALLTAGLLGLMTYAWRRRK